jgi:large subunit ribosomal protein L17
LASALILHGRIETSVVKAKFVKPFVEKLITKAKDSSYNSVRLLRSRLGNEEALRKLFSEVAPEFKERNGGYTRIRKLGIVRKGDSSEMAMIELVSNTKESTVVKEIKEAKKVSKSKAKKEEVVEKSTPQILTEEISKVEEAK